jgi:uncharacterized protein YjbI with pentapeptide repeats
MACYENYSKELILNKYKEKEIFSGDTIRNNDLSGIICPGIQFHHTTIQRSNLDRALWEKMVCQNVVIEQSNCNALQAMDSRIQNSSVIHCNSIKADFSHATIHQTRFEKCTAHSIRFTGARITDSVFFECQMYKARFDRTILMKVSFLPGEKGDLSTLQKATFEHSMLIDCSFSHINLIDAVFSNTVLIGCDFTGTILEDTERINSSFIQCKSTL